MTLSGPTVDWQAWFERWEAQQSCYVERQYRFGLMLQWPGFPRNAEVSILNRGCGPGSEAFRAVEHYPRARVLAVDADPVLLTMGREVAGHRLVESSLLRPTSVMLIGGPPMMGSSILLCRLRLCTGSAQET